MLTPEEMARAAADLRDRALALVGEHEHARHDGRPCWGHRSGLVAYLAHCLGVRGAHWRNAELLGHAYGARMCVPPCPGAEPFPPESLAGGAGPGNG